MLLLFKLKKVGLLTVATVTIFNVYLMTGLMYRPVTVSGILSQVTARGDLLQKHLAPDSGYQRGKRFSSTIIG
jgi:hypothetical protein